MQKVIEIRNTFQLAIIALQINLIGDDTATEESLRIEINCLVICFFFFNIERHIRKNSRIVLKHRATKCQVKAAVKQNE